MGQLADGAKLKMITLNKGYSSLTGTCFVMSNAPNLNVGGNFILDYNNKIRQNGTL